MIPAGYWHMNEPARPAYREFTVAAFVLGVLQGIVLNLSFIYAALKLGFGIGGSTVASIMGYALLRGVLRKGTMVENNLNQTIASGINTAGTGVVFTLPALYMLDAKWRAEGLPGLDFELGPLILAGIAGAVLGVVLIIPLRKQMIELDRLRFPDGVATATIIRAGSAGMEKAVLLAAGVVVSALVKLAVSTELLNTPGLIERYGFGVLGEELQFGFHVLPEYVSPVLNLSLMNLAAGMLSGRHGLPFFFGGALAWWIIAPFAVQNGYVPADGEEIASLIYLHMLRPLGIGVLVGGALMGVVASLPAIRSALASLSQASKTASAGKRLGSDELSLKTLVVGMLAAMVLFFVAAKITPEVGVGGALIASVIGTVWLGLAALIVAQATGLTDISPMSGMALISVTLMMFLLNQNVVAAMVVGVAVCVAIGQAADMMQDLKTGFMIGARPIKQQLAQLSITWIGALLAIFVISLLWRSGPDQQGGFGTGTDLPAPQAGALMGIIDSVKSGNVPIDKYVMGGCVGALLGSAPTAGLGVLVGLSMYLPFSITLGYGLGCFLQMFLLRVKGLAFCEHRLVPFAAGLIVGEALTGISYTAYQLLG